METDPAATLESLVAEPKVRWPDEQLQVIVPMWWVQQWGREAIDAAASRLQCKITPVNTWEEAHDELTALVYVAGTWHFERTEPIDLSGATQ